MMLIGPLKVMILLNLMSPGRLFQNWYIKVQSRVNIAQNSATHPGPLLNAGAKFER